MLVQTGLHDIPMPFFWLICLICFISTLLSSLISTLCRHNSALYKEFPLNFDVVPYPFTLLTLLWDGQSNPPGICLIRQISQRS